MKISMKLATFVLSFIFLPALADSSSPLTDPCEKGQLTPVEFFKPDHRYGVLVIFELGRGGFPVDAKSFEGPIGQEHLRLLEFGKRYLVCGEMTEAGFMIWQLTKR